MLDCLVIGDSLAVGVGLARPACETVAQVGITSGKYLQTFLPSARQNAGSVVVSLGVNDDPSMATSDNLHRLRRELHASEVIWLLPGLKDGVRRIIFAIAAEHGDRLLDTQQQAGPDHLHPTDTGYRLIASWIEASSRPGKEAGKHVLSAAGLRYALLDPVPSVEPARQTTTPRQIGALHASMPPVVSHPETYKGRVLYQLWPAPGVIYAAIPPSSYAYGAFRRPIASR